MPRSKKPWWLLLFLPFLLGAGGESPSSGDDDDDDDNDDDGPKVDPLGPIFPAVIGEPKEDPIGPIQPKPPVNPDGPVGPIFPAEIIDPGEPGPAEVDDIIRTYPTPGTYYQVKKGDVPTGGKGIATKYAKSALFLAAQKHGGLGLEGAREWARVRGDSYVKGQLPAWKLVECAPINDASYGTYAFSAKSVPGPQGRAIRLLPDHAPNRIRIRQGEPPARNIRIGSPGDPSSVSAVGVVSGWNDYELLWLPDIDLEQLWLSDGTVWEPGGSWSDGSSKIHPPPKIYELGLVDFTDSNTGIWGCVPHQAEISA